MRIKIENPPEVPDGPEVLVIGGREYVIYPPTADGFRYLTPRRCPHANADLKEYGRVVESAGAGERDGQLRVVCERHKCGWDAITMMPVEGRCSNRLIVYLVIQESDGLYVDLPSLD